MARGLTHLFCSYCILGDPPSMPEAIGQFEYGKNELSLGRAAFLEPSLQSQALDRRRV